MWPSVHNFVSRCYAWFMVARLGSSICLLVAIAAYAGTAPAANEQAAPAETLVVVPDGFVRGEAFLNMVPAWQRAYVMGLFDGFMLAPMFDGSEARVQTLKACVTSMTNSQLTAIFVQFLKTNPARWHQTANSLFHAALREVCGEF